MRNIIIFILSLIFFVMQVLVLIEVSITASIFFTIALLVLFITLLILIPMDAKSRGMTAPLWAILAVLTGVATIGIIYSLITFFKKT